MIVSPPDKITWWDRPEQSFSGSGSCCSGTAHCCAQVSVQYTVCADCVHSEISVSLARTSQDASDDLGFLWFTSLTVNLSQTVNFTKRGCSRPIHNKDHGLPGFQLQFHPALLAGHQSGDLSKSSHTSFEFVHSRE